MSDKNASSTSRPWSQSRPNLCASRTRASSAGRRGHPGVDGVGISGERTSPQPAFGVLAAVCSLGMASPQAPRGWSTRSCPGGGVHGRGGDEPSLRSSIPRTDPRRPEAAAASAFTPPL